MKYKYRFIELNNGSKVLKMELPKEIELVSAFLLGTARNENWFIEGINEVLSGLSDYQERDGEFYGLEIRREFTRVHDALDQGEECTIETSELKELIEIWSQERKKTIIED